MADGAWFLVQTFRRIADLPPAVQIAAAGAVIAILVVFMLAVQSGGSRSGSASESGRGNPDDCWKWWHISRQFGERTSESSENTECTRISQAVLAPGLASVAGNGPMG